MRKALLSPLVIVMSLLLVVSACRTNRVVRVYHPPVKHMPPGQAKKVYGHQSAKAFAPGQQKKRTTVVYPANKVVVKGDAGQKGNSGKGKGKKK